MTVADIQIAILNGKFTDRELRDINGTIVTILKADRKKKVNEAKRNLAVGMEVIFQGKIGKIVKINRTKCCLLYTSPSPRDQRGSRMPSSA